MSEDNDNVLDMEEYKDKKRRLEAKKIMESILKRSTCTINLEEEEK